MTTSGWFDDLPVLGKLSPEQAAARLREVGEDEVAGVMEAAQEQARRGAETFGLLEILGLGDKPWQHTAHTFGYLAPAPPGDKLLPIQHAGNIAADPTLKNTRITITLNCLRVAAYPGSGIHRVLFDFYAQNQVPGNTEHLHFNATLRVQEGERAAILGYPIFVGLNVGSEGVAFKCFTVNVKNDDDEAFLGFLESDVFRAGLKLVSTLQPALVPLSGLALGLTKTIASRHRNVAVQDFYLGLDFSQIPMGARLAEGAYLAIQIPESLQVVWDWDEWVYNPTNGQVVNQTDTMQLIPYNYVVFGVSRYEGQ